MKFKRPFTLAHGTRDHTDVVITYVEQDGVQGFGEATLPPYIGESQNSVGEFLNECKTFFATFDPLKGHEDFSTLLHSVSPKYPAARASVDMAYHDLVGKIKGIPARELFGIRNSSPVTSAYTITNDTDEGLEQRILESRDFSLLKIKLGTNDDSRFLDRMDDVLSKSFFVDANEGWKQKEKAIERIEWLAERGCLFVEQPMPRSNLQDLRWLKAKSPIPILADEGVQNVTDVPRIEDAYHGINVKLMKCGGMIEAKKMIDLARNLNMKVMIGCMSESSCGVSAAAQLAHLCDWADLDGPVLIQEDLFDGLEIKNGRIILSNAPGLGITPRPGILPKRSV